MPLEEGFITMVYNKGNKTHRGGVCDVLKRRKVIKAMKFYQANLNLDNDVFQCPKKKCGYDEKVCTISAILNFFSTKMFITTSLAMNE